MNYALFTLFLATVGGCAAPMTDADMMEAPRTAPNVDFANLDALDRAMAEPWLELASTMEDTQTIQSFYEARGCFRTESLLGVTDEGEREYPDTVRYVAIDEGLYVIVEQELLCGGSRRPNLVTVFEADALDDPNVDGWMESYGVLRDEQANLFERVEAYDGVAQPEVISLNPPNLTPE